MIWFARLYLHPQGNFGHGQALLYYTFKTATNSEVTVFNKERFNKIKSLVRPHFFTEEIITGKNFTFLVINVFKQILYNVVIFISFLKPSHLMEFNPLKQRKTTLFFKNLFITVKVYFYDNPVTKKNYFSKFCVSWRQ